MTFKLVKLPPCPTTAPIWGDGGIYTWSTYLTRILTPPPNKLGRHKLYDSILPKLEDYHNWIMILFSHQSWGSLSLPGEDRRSGQLANAFLMTYYIAARVICLHAARGRMLLLGGVAMQPWCTEDLLYKLTPVYKRRTVSGLGIYSSTDRRTEWLAASRARWAQVQAYIAPRRFTSTSAGRRWR